MKTIHELRLENIEYNKSRIKAIERQIAEKTPMDKTELIVWELAETLNALLSRYAYVRLQESRDINIFVTKLLPVDLLEKMHQTIEEELSYYDYTLDEEYSNNERFEYFSPKYNGFTIYLSSDFCERVATGKMAPVMKNQCKILEDI